MPKIFQTLKLTLRIHSSTCWDISSGVRCRRPWQTGHDWHCEFRNCSVNSDSESLFLLRVLALKRPCRFVRILWNVCSNVFINIQFFITKTIKPTSQRLSGPCNIPLVGCIPDDILKLARSRCRSEPELNLYNRSNSVKKWASSSFTLNWIPQTGHVFGGGVPIVGFLTGMPEMHLRKSTH